MAQLLSSSVRSDGRVNLLVANLPYRVRWQDLKDLFRKAGVVVRADVVLGPHNRSRGYGTVLMGSQWDAERAIGRFDGFIWQARMLRVRPDGLPPDHVPQPDPHSHRNASRFVIHVDHNLPEVPHPPIPLPCYPFSPHDQPWYPCQLRPRMPGGAGHGGGLPGLHPLLADLAGSGMVPSPDLRPSLPFAASPSQPPQSLPSIYGAVGPPLLLTGLNAGGHNLGSSGAPPLAGCLSSNAAPRSISTGEEALRGGCEPFAHYPSPGSTIQQLSSISSAVASPQLTRTTSPRHSASAASTFENPFQVGGGGPSEAPPPSSTGFGTASRAGVCPPLDPNIAGQPTFVPHSRAGSIHEHRAVGPQGSPGFLDGLHGETFAMARPMESLNPLCPLQLPARQSLRGFAFDAYIGTPPVHLPQLPQLPAGVTGPLSPLTPATSSMPFTYDIMSFNPARGAPANSSLDAGCPLLGVSATQAVPRRLSFSTAPPTASPSQWQQQQVVQHVMIEEQGYSIPVMPPRSGDSSSPGAGMRYFNPGSPLNANERMTSSLWHARFEDELPTMTNGGRLRVGGVVGVSNARQQTTDIPSSGEDRAWARRTAGDGHDLLSRREGSSDEKGLHRARHSLDEHRPSPTVGQGKRRASFG